MASPALRWVWLGTVGYEDAWALQREMARRVGAARSATTRCSCSSILPCTRWAARARHAISAPGRDALVAAGAEFLEVDRGGSVTFHGPGQLVAYPIVRLAGVFPIPRHPAHGDVDRYLRALEAGLIATAAAYGVAGDPPPAVHRRVVGRAEARRDRREARGRGHHPWRRAERRNRPALVRPDHAVRHRGRRGRVARDPWRAGHTPRRSRRCSPLRSRRRSDCSLRGAGPLDALVRSPGRERAAA